jgi:GTP-binding protein YchF
MSSLAHVVRCFEDENITHVDGSVDPKRDVEVVNLELILADLDTVSKRIIRCEKLLKTNDKENKIHYEILQKLKKELQSGKLINLQDYETGDQKIIKQFQLLCSKPTFYIANIDDSDNSKKHFNELEKVAKDIGSSVIPASIKIEQEISLLQDDEKLEYLELLDMDEPVLNKIIFEGYKMLGLKTFFTAGPKEIRAWTIKEGFSAPNAAGVIHTDFERGFIKAEVIDYDDFIKCNGELGAKEKGKLRLEGKDYLVEDGDVIHFKFNV